MRRDAIALGSTRRVAIKFCLDPTLTSSLTREVELMEHLQQGGACENIVQLLGTALSAESPFLVFEYIDGGDLAGWLASFDAGSPSPKNTLRALTMIARGLRKAHELGVVHHDIKPSNLLVSRDGQVKLADFGIGRLVHRSELQLAAAGQVSLFEGAGTPMYFDTETSGSKRDVYAVGIVAYQLLQGNIVKPIPPNWRESLRRRGAPSELIEIVARCVDVPDRRFADASVLCEALEALDRSRERDSARPTLDRTEASSGRSQGSRATPRTRLLTAGALVFMLGSVYLGTQREPASAGKTSDGPVSAAAQSRVSPAIDPAANPPPKPVPVRVFTDIADAVLLIDGTSRGSLPSAGKGLELQPGAHRVEAMKDGSVVAVEVVAVREGVSLDVFLTMPVGHTPPAPAPPAAPRVTTPAVARTPPLAHKPVSAVPALHHTASAWADGEARAEYAQGKSAFDQARYQEAYEHFSRAYTLSDRPELLNNLGVTAEKLGRPELAAQLYQNYVKRLPTAGNRAAVETRLGLLTSR